MLAVNFIMSENVYLPSHNLLDFNMITVALIQQPDNVNLVPSIEPGWK